MRLYVGLLRAICAAICVGGLGAGALALFTLPASPPDEVPVADSSAAAFTAPVQRSSYWAPVQQGSYWLARADIPADPFSDPAAPKPVYTVTDTRPGWVQVAPVICHEGCNLGLRKAYKLSAFHTTFVFRSNP
jgi:hypothetical protein